jgi:ribosome maturation factor RimP
VTTDAATRVSELVSPLLEAHGKQLYDVVHGGATLQVLVSGTVDLDELARLTHEISTVLDDADPIEERYTLEVSTPGLERTLRVPRHYSSAIGEKVKIKLAPTVESDRRVEGTLVAADADGFVIDTGTTQRRLSYSDVERARTVFEWGSEKPTSPSKAAPKSKTKKKESA